MTAPIWASPTGIIVNVSSDPGHDTAHSVADQSRQRRDALRFASPSAADAIDNFGVVGVQFQLNGANLGLEDTVAPYEIVWNTLTSANGAYSLTAIARDAAGNQATSPMVTVTVDNPIDTTPPTVTDGQSGRRRLERCVGQRSDNHHVQRRHGPGDHQRQQPSNCGTDADTLVAATVTYDAPSRTATLTPTSPMVDGTLYTATVRGGATDPRAKDLAGNALAQDYVWSFVARGVANCPCSIWDASAVPANPAEHDASAVEVGVKFQADLDGNITGIRFYKGAGNTGDPYRQSVDEHRPVVGNRHVRRTRRPPVGNRLDFAGAGGDQRQCDLCRFVS